MQAEGEGFEPSVTFATPVFKTGAIGRSATPPNRHFSSDFHTLFRFLKNPVLLLYYRLYYRYNHTVVKVAPSGHHPLEATPPEPFEDGGDAMSSNPTRKPRSRKAATDRPRKPYPDFPLTPHASGAWQKKILGKIHYFGKWAKRVNGKLTRIEGDGWKEALEIYKAQADDLHAGRTPRVKGDSLTVADLCNRFLTAKQRKLEAREIGPRMFSEYKVTTDRLVTTFGKTRLVDDLAADDSRNCGLTSQNSLAQCGSATKSLASRAFSSMPTTMACLKNRCDMEQSSANRAKPCCESTRPRAAET